MFGYSLSTPHHASQLLGSHLERMHHVLRGEPYALQKKRLSGCLLTDNQVERTHHGIIVAVDHDGPTASKVNVLFPPITDLCEKGGYIY